MYGFVTDATIQFLSTLENGKELVEQLKEALGDDADISFYKHYSDEFTLHVVEVAATITGLSFNDVILGMGRVQLDNFTKHGYRPLIESLGASFYECLQHIDILHQNLVNSYPGMTAPSFRPELSPEGVLYLHYYSSRPGLWPYATALLKSVATDIYKIDVEFEHYQKKSEGHNHDMFIVHMPPKGFGERQEDKLKKAADKFATFDCDAETFNVLFPWHMEINRKMEVVGMGSLLEARMHSELDTSQTPHLHDIVKIKQPALIKQTFDALKERNHDNFMAIVRDDWYHEKKEMKRQEKYARKAAKKQEKAMAMLHSRKQSVSLAASPTSPTARHGVNVFASSPGSPRSISSSAIFHAMQQQGSGSTNGKFAGSGAGCPFSSSPPAHVNTTATIIARSRDGSTSSIHSRMHQTASSSSLSKRQSASGCPFSSSSQTGRRTSNLSALQMLSDHTDVSFQTCESTGSSEGSGRRVSATFLESAMTKRPSCATSLKYVTPITRNISETLSYMVASRRASANSVMSMSSIEAEAFITEAVDYLYLKGEIVYREDTDTLLLLGNPECSTPAELFVRDLSLADLPVHSNTRDMLFSTVHQSATISIAGRLESTSKELVHAQQQVQSERIRVKKLLHSILPEEVAVALASGDIPEAQRFSSVSVLFSDIPAFEKIVGSVRPTQVMDLLNEMFSKFDELCEQFGLYKVETVGDSYMVASGLPSPNPKQATNMAKFSVKMMQLANTVLSPVDGSPLTLRVGMHTGPIMAGVVGKTRPRYCLFGDTVNVASRMESTTVPGTIHYSASMMSALMEEKAEIQWISRGDIEVKGKGLMETFFLLGIDRKIKSLVPPESAFDTSKLKTGSKGKSKASVQGALDTPQGMMKAMQQQMEQHAQTVQQQMMMFLQAQMRMLQLQNAKGNPPKKQHNGYYTVHMHRVYASEFGTSTCDGVAFDTRLEDVVETALAGAEVGMKLFTSAQCTTLVLQDIPVGELVQRGFVSVSKPLVSEAAQGCNGELHFYADGLYDVEDIDLDLRRELGLISGFDHSMGTDDNVDDVDVSSAGMGQPMHLSHGVLLEEDEEDALEV
eukprot:m.36766 g.36766  ORF g.36766 m.36766 type:complete len:1076 (+) comp10036_c0_seq1:827-4054(+)